MTPLFGAPLPAPTSPTDRAGTGGRFFRSLILTLFVASMLAGARTPLAQAQGAWTQTQFMIGTFVDPHTPDGVLSPAQNAAALHINLMTGVPISGGAGLYPKLDAAAATGMVALASDGSFSGQQAYRRPYTPSAGEAVFVNYRSLSPERNAALEGYMLWDEPLFDSPDTWNDIKDWTGAMHDEDVARNDGRYRAVYVNMHSGCNNPGDPNCYPAYLDSVLNDPDPNRRPDVSGTDLYPFNTSTPYTTGNYFRPMKLLRQALGSRPFWIISKMDEGIVGSSSLPPDANQLRFMTFGPVAAGAKGIIWFTYRNDCAWGFCWYDAMMNEGEIPTYKTDLVRPIDRYLRNVLGPVVMSSDHLGLFHQSTTPTGSIDVDASTDLLSTGGVGMPVLSLGNDNLAVGIFRPQAAPDEYYLLVINKSLFPASGTVTLAQAYAVTRAPSVVGYVGGTSYTPVTSGSTFPVSLAGGEGQLFRLTTTATLDYAVSISAGADRWLPGQSRSVQWTDFGSPADVEIYPDPQFGTTDISGPHAVAASGVLGGQALITMPNIGSNRARLVVRSLGTDGVSRSVVHDQVISTATFNQQTSTFQLVGPSERISQPALVIRSSGQHVLAYRGAYGQPMLAKYNGSEWTVEEVYPWVVQWPRPLVDVMGQDHVAYFKVESGMAVDAFRFGGSWVEMPLYDTGATATTGGLPSNTASILESFLAPNGDQYIIFNAGPAGGGQLKIHYRGAYDLIPVPWGGLRSASNPRSISAAVDPSGVLWVAFVEDAGATKAIRVMKYFVSSETVSLSMTGNFEHVALLLDSAGKPRIAYSEVTGSDGSTTLFYRQYDTSWQAPVTVDATPGTIDGVAMTWNGSNATIAYTGNGLARQAMQSGANWNVLPVEAVSDAVGPIQVGYNGTTSRWIAYGLPAAGGVRVVAPPQGGGGAPCQPCDPCDPCPILPAITLQTPNPLTSGETIAFDLRLPRDATFEAHLVDVAGRRVAEGMKVGLAAGNHRQTMRLTGVRPGIYFIRYRIGSEPFRTSRVVLLR